MKHLHTPAARRHAVALAALSAVAAPALGADWDLSGQVRQEIAVKTTGDQNKANQTGNPYNGVTYSSTGLLPAEDLTRPASFSDKAKIGLRATRAARSLPSKDGEASGEMDPETSSG